MEPSSRKYILLLGGVLAISVFCMVLSIYNFKEGSDINLYYTSFTRSEKGDTRIEIDRKSELMKEGFYRQKDYEDRAARSIAAALTLPAVFFCMCFVALLIAAFKRTRSLRDSIKQVRGVLSYALLNGSVSVYLFTLFCAALGMVVMAPALAILCLKIFPLVTQGSGPAFVAVVALVVLAGAFVVYILYRKGRGRTALAVIITGASALISGIPGFIVENNHQIWHATIFTGPPPYPLSFWPQADALIMFVFDFHRFLFDSGGLLLAAIAYILLYPLACLCLYLWRRKRRKALLAAVLLPLVFFAACTTLGKVTAPSEYDMHAAAKSINVSSAEEAFKDIRIVFKGIKYSGKYIFDECRTNAITKEGFDVTCIMYDEDTTYKYTSKDSSFRLRATGTYAVTIPLCPPVFKAVRQFPLFVTHYFFVNRFSFDGDDQRALRAYSLLKYYCEH